MRTLLVGMIACAALALGVGCASAPESGVAQAPPPPGPDLAQLEAIFWSCDYVATTRGIDATPMRECAAATRELRQLKFEGSFQRMLAWWRENKPAVHGRLRAERNDPPL